MFVTVDGSLRISPNAPNFKETGGPEQADSGTEIQLTVSSDVAYTPAARQSIASEEPANAARGTNLPTNYPPACS